jgi:pSer/pThr/pTyr-binding forkhead associated (FHA) protein
MAMKVSLTVAVPGDMQGMSIPIRLAEFLIGRDPRCHLCPDSTAVGRIHCLLHLRDDGVFLRNLDQRTGTFVNDRHIEGEIQLLDGDRLRIGPLLFDTRIEGGVAGGVAHRGVRADTAAGVPLNSRQVVETEAPGPALGGGKGDVGLQRTAKPLLSDQRARASYYLIIANGKHRGTPIRITDDLFMIGNDSICQLQPKLPETGGRHCALVTRDAKVFVRDMNSGFPTMLKGEVISPGEEWPAHAGDPIEVGALQLMIQYREKPLSGRDLEEWAASCLDVSADRELFDEDADAFHKATTAAQAAAVLIDRLQKQRGLVKGRLRIGIQSGITMVRFNDRHLVDEGEIAMIRKELCDNLARNNLRVLLDCKNVARMSSGALKMLDEFRAWLGPWGSSLALCRIRSDLLQTMRSVAPGLAVVPVYADKRAGLEARW